MTYPTGPVLMESVSGNDGRNGKGALCLRADGCCGVVEVCGGRCRWGR